MKIDNDIPEIVAGCGLLILAVFFLLVVIIITLKISVFLWRAL